MDKEIIELINETYKQTLEDNEYLYKQMIAHMSMISLILVQKGIINIDEYTKFVTDDEFNKNLEDEINKIFENVKAKVKQSLGDDEK